MTFFTSVSDAIVDFVKAGSTANQASVVNDVLAEAEKWKPVSYDADNRRRRDHYEGRGSKWIRAKLKDYFPKSYEKIPILPFNFAKLHAEVAAAVYDEEPGRELLQDGEPLDKEDERSKRFAELLRKAQLRTVMADAERVMHWSGSVVIVARWRKYFDTKKKKLLGRVCLDLYWPHEVGVVPHPSAPTDPNLAVAFIIQVAGPSGTSPVQAEQYFELWTREAQEDELGQVAGFGPWFVSIISRKGDVDAATKRGTPVEYKGEITPIIIANLSSPRGSPFFDPGLDDVDVVESLNVDTSDAAYIEHLQGHTDRVYKGSRDGGKQTGGPDSTTQIDPGEELDTLDYNPKIVELMESQEARRKLWAATKRHSQGAYSVDSAAPASGVARQIENEPQEKMRQEQVAKAKELEELLLLPLLVDVFDTFSGEASIGADGVEFRFTPATRPTYEDPEARQRRVLEAKDAGLISEARAAVECGYYATVEEAVEKGLSDELQAKPPPMPFGASPFGGGPPSPFAARMAAKRPPPADPNANDDPNAADPASGRGGGANANEAAAAPAGA
jgi:hypothetical protein